MQTPTACNELLFVLLGSEEFRSDHLIIAGKSLNVLLSLLFRAIAIHGHYPHNLSVSTIISIPKDLKLSLCNVDNNTEAYHYLIQLPKFLIMSSLNYVMIN